MTINKNKVMDAARKAQEKGQYDKAIKEYLKVVKDDPKDVRVWLKIGDLYAKKGAKQDATDTYLKVATFYSEQGFYLKAVAVYKQILKLDPRLVEVNLKLAELYRQLGLLSDAMQHFEMVAAFFHREGQTKEALATIRQLVDLDPENVATRIKLAELYSKEQMVDEAVTEFRNACDFLRRHNRQDDFIKVAERLLFHKAEDIELCRELATLYLRRGDPRRALAKLQICFKSDQGDIDTLGLLAQAFQKLEQKGKTVSVLKEMARLLSDRGETRKAEDVHRKILGFAPEDPDSRAFLGEPAPAPEPAPDYSPPESAPLPPPSSEPIGRTTGSMSLIESPDAHDSSAFVDEDSFVAELELEEESNIYSVEGGSVGGEVHSDEIIKILTETDVYVKYGLHQKAVEHLRRVFALDPDNLEARERLREILLSQGREQEAIQELMVLAERTVHVNPPRAAGYLQEIFAIDASYAPAHELIERHRLGVSAAQSVPRGGGAVAVAEDELDFDDLDFELSGSSRVPLDGSALNGSGPVAKGSGTDVMPQDDVGDVEFDFALDDDSVEGALPPKAPITMEVDLEQVEESVPVAELGGDDLDFDYQAPDLDAALSGDSGVGVAADIRPPPGGELTPPPEIIDDFEFDPDDARAFDAARPVEGAAAPLHLDFDPVGDEISAAAPSPYQPPAEGPIFGADVEGDASTPGSYEPLDLEEVEEIPDEFVELAPETGVGPLEAGIPTAEDVLPAAAAPDLNLDDGDITPPDDAPGGARRGSERDPSFDFGSLDASLEGSAATQLEDDLDEADFFVSQGLFEEATEILNGLLKRYPNNPLVMSKIQEIQTAASGGAVTTEPQDAFVATAEPPLQESAQRSVILENPVDDEDADTHFDLGLAYKEMGLFDEAVKAFNKVIEVPGRAVKCNLMIGLCHREQGNLSEAINQFKAGLYVREITSAEKLGLYYEIGSAYVDLRDPQEALYYFEMVLKKDPDYRDVAERVAQIKTDNVGGQTTPDGGALDDETDSALDELLAEPSDHS